MHLTRSPLTLPRAAGHRLVLVHYSSFTNGHEPIISWRIKEISTTGLRVLDFSYYKYCIFLVPGLSLESPPPHSLFPAADKEGHTFSPVWFDQHSQLHAPTTDV